MAENSQAHDKQVLHKLGYAQELSRRMSGFSNFAISFSIICILAGGISAFPAAFNALGSGGAFLIWLVGGVLAFQFAGEQRLHNTAVWQRFRPVTLVSPPQAPRLVWMFPVLEFGTRSSF